MKRLAVLDNEKCIGCQNCMFACARRSGQGGLSQSRIGIKSKSGIENGFTVIVCRACKDPSCLKVCPTKALTLKPSGGVSFNSNKCIGCERCIGTCPIGAVFWDGEINKPMICTACGYCASYCPCNVIAIEEISQEVANA